MKALRYLTLLAAVALIQGCARPKNNIVEVEVPGFDEDRPGDHPVFSGKPGMVPLRDSSGGPIALGTFNQFLGTKPIQGTYMPDSIRFGMEVMPAGDGYVGYVQISFMENGQEVDIYQQTKDPHRSSYRTQDGQYNVWLTQGANNTWHGFFQDRIGAVVVVIDGISAGGTGDNPNDQRLSGSVWFKNFDNQFPNNPNQGFRPCWEITVGPYDCRTFLVDKPLSEMDANERERAKSFKSANYKVDTRSALYPGIGYTSDSEFTYRKLGDFEGLSIESTFVQ